MNSDSTLVKACAYGGMRKSHARCDDIVDGRKRKHEGCVVCGARCSCVCATDAPRCAPPIDDGTGHGTL